MWALREKIFIKLVISFRSSSVRILNQTAIDAKQSFVSATD